MGGFFTALYFSIFVVAISGENVSNETLIQNTNDTGKIVGGLPTDTSEFPFIVSLQTDLGHFCAGSIILPQWILTAAHCIYRMPCQAIKIRAGITNLDDRSYQERRVVACHIYPYYDPQTFKADIGVIKLDRRLIYHVNNIRAVRLHSGPFLAQEYLKIAGWGRTKENGHTSKTLLKVTVPVIHYQECQRQYGNNYKFYPGVICGGYPEGGKDSCQGDSGGPAISLESGTQIGIVSWGVGCARPGFPGVYEMVSNLQPWIENLTGERLER